MQQPTQSQPSATPLQQLEAIIHDVNDIKMTGDAMKLIIRINDCKLALRKSLNDANADVSQTCAQLREIKNCLDQALQGITIPSFPYAAAALGGVVGATVGAGIGISAAKTAFFTQKWGGVVGAVGGGALGITGGIGMGDEINSGSLLQGSKDQVWRVLNLWRQDLGRQILRGEAYLQRAEQSAKEADDSGLRRRH